MVTGTVSKQVKTDIGNHIDSVVENLKKEMTTKMSELKEVLVNTNQQVTTDTTMEIKDVILENMEYSVDEL